MVMGCLFRAPNSLRGVGPYGPEAAFATLHAFVLDIQGPCIYAFA